MMKRMRLENTKDLSVEISTIVKIEIPRVEHLSFFILQALGMTT
jgi:hypothetical protein